MSKNDDYEDRMWAEAKFRHADWKPKVVWPDGEKPKSDSR